MGLEGGADQSYYTADALYGSYYTDESYYTGESYYIDDQQVLGLELQQKVTTMEGCARRCYDLPDRCNV